MDHLRQNKIRVRFAPSPTGHLHIGGLRTALFNYLFARKNNGSYLLRIEDTDIARSTDDFKQSIIDSFDWIGLLPDEPILIQSSRFNEHMAVVDTLIQQKKAYRCYCTEEMLLNRIGKSEGLFVHYDRYCFGRDNSELDKRSHPFVVRFLMSRDDASLYAFDDLIRDRIIFQSDHFDDFIIVRSDGVPVYNLVVVIDDVYMGITHVIRGEEHIPNTPKQIALYKACGYAIPRFAHLPMILGPQGQKLSKRDGAKSVYEYKAEGYLPDALINYLARLGWSHGDQEIFTRAELESFFTLEAIGKKGAIFDQAKLDWMNGQFLKKMSAQEILDYIKENLDSNFGFAYQWPRETVLQAIDLFKGRVATVRSLMSSCDTLFYGPPSHLFESHRHLFSANMKTAFQMIFDLVQNSSLDQEILKKIAKNNDLEPVALMQLLRLALIGQLTGPGFFDLVKIIGCSEASVRISKAQNFFN